MNFELHSDEYFMKQAFIEAEKALEKDEVPVGAVIVCENRVIARAHNLCEQLNDFTAHAEMQVFTSATDYLQSKYLNECTLFVTLEPCIMCAGASFWSRIQRVVYGAADSKRGFSTYNTPVFHPKTSVSGGVMKKECSDIITTYFQTKRK